METKTNTNQNPDKSRKVIRIVISILVAIALWVYVDRGLSVEVTMKVNNVPVEFSGRGHQPGRKEPDAAVGL